MAPIGWAGGTCVAVASGFARWATPDKPLPPRHPVVVGWQGRWAPAHPKNPAGPLVCALQEWPLCVEWRYCGPGGMCGRGQVVKEAFAWDGEFITSREMRV